MFILELPLEPAEEHQIADYGAKEGEVLHTYGDKYYKLRAFRCMIKWLRSMKTNVQSVQSININVSMKKHFNIPIQAFTSQHVVGIAGLF